MKKKTANPGRKILIETTEERGRGFSELIDLIRSAKTRAHRAVNGELIALYWEIGEYLDRKFATDGWSDTTIENLSYFVQDAQAGKIGFSAANLWQMREFYTSYKHQAELAIIARELPWTHHLLIMEGCKGEAEREFYLRLAVNQKWSRQDVEHHVKSGLYEQAVKLRINRTKRTKMDTANHHPAASMDLLETDPYLQEFLTSSFPSA